MKENIYVHMYGCIYIYIEREREIISESICCTPETQHLQSLYVSAKMYFKYDFLFRYIELEIPEVHLNRHSGTQTQE